MTNANGSAFWIDRDHDREASDTGRGPRYRVYLRDHRNALPNQDDYDDLTVPFAVAAWRIATGPIMTPGLVRRHPRLVAVSVRRSGWNGQPLVDVDLVAPRPSFLTFAQDSKGGYYRDNVLDAWGTYTGITEDQLGRESYLGTTLRLVAQLPSHEFPTVTAIPTDLGELYHLATSCVTALVDELNKEIQPVLDALESN
jgi:hypothetical protein